MKLKVNKYEYVKTLLEDVEINIPDTPFAFKNGRGCMVLVTPRWTTWQMKNDKTPEEIYELKIISASSYHSDIEVASISMNPTSLEGILSSMLHAKSYSLAQKVLDKIMNYPDEDNVAIEEFKIHYQNILAELDENYINVK